jgi:solute carrier family 25 S-adenosylmethionine transporter 26
MISAFLLCMRHNLSHTQIRSIVAKEGMRGLYAGYGAFLLRDLPFDAIEFVAYEQLRKAAGRLLQRDPNPVEVSIVGALAGGFTGKA